jgi:hypothetical protein
MRDWSLLKQAPITGICASSLVALRRAIRANHIGDKSMAIWVECTRNTDASLIYLNLDNAIWLRWNDEEHFTAVSWINGLTETMVRVRETPDEIFSKVASLWDV